MICPKCGCVMTGKYAGGTITNKKPSGKVYTYERDYHSYRCNKAYQHSLCSFKMQLNEDKIEKVLLDDFDQYVNATITEASATDDRANVDNELINKQIIEVKTEMTKVKRMYRKGDIDEAEYDNDMAELKEELETLESQLEPLTERDLTIYEDLLKSDWKSLYKALNKENKRAFWRKYIQRIELNNDGTVKHPIFF